MATKTNYDVKSLDTNAKGTLNNYELIFCLVYRVNEIGRRVNVSCWAKKGKKN